MHQRINARVARSAARDRSGQVRRIVHRPRAVAGVIFGPRVRPSMHAGDAGVVDQAHGAQFVGHDPPGTFGFTRIVQPRKRGVSVVALRDVLPSEVVPCGLDPQPIGAGIHGFHPSDAPFVRPATRVGIRVARVDGQAAIVRATLHVRRVERADHLLRLAALKNLLVRLPRAAFLFRVRRLAVGSEQKPSAAGFGADGRHVGVDSHADGERLGLGIMGECGSVHDERTNGTV